MQARRRWRHRVRPGPARPKFCRQGEARRPGPGCVPLGSTQSRRRPPLSSSGIGELSFVRWLRMIDAALAPSPRGPRGSLCTIAVYLSLHLCIPSFAHRPMPTNETAMTMTKCKKCQPAMNKPTHAQPMNRNAVCQKQPISLQGALLNMDTEENCSEGHSAPRLRLSNAPPPPPSRPSAMWNRGTSMKRRPN